MGIIVLSKQLILALSLYCHHVRQLKQTAKNIRAKNGNYCIIQAADPCIILYCHHVRPLKQTAKDTRAKNGNYCIIQTADPCLILYCHHVRQLKQTAKDIAQLLINALSFAVAFRQRIGIAQQLGL